MIRIAIIDDNTDSSETLKRLISLELNECGHANSVIDHQPFATYDEYFNFFESNEINFIILDEKLNGGANPENTPVGYIGSDLVSIIRERYKNIPIFSISGYGATPELKNKFGVFDEVIKRSQFDEDIKQYIQRIVRSVEKYLEENEDELQEYNRLSIDIAQGNVTPESLTRFEALQTKLSLPFSGINTMNNWLDAYEQQIQKLEEIDRLLNEKIKYHELGKGR